MSQSKIESLMHHKIVGFEDVPTIQHNSLAVGSKVSLTYIGLRHAIAQLHFDAAAFGLLLFA